MILTPSPHLADLIFDEATHTYTYQGREIPSVTRIIREVGMSSFGNPTGTTRPMQIGKWIHEMLRLDLSNKLDESTLSPIMKMILNDVRAWAKRIDLKSLVLETPLVHSLYRFSGTPDLIGLAEEKLTIFDWKWGEPRPSDLVQLAGYWLLALNCYEDLPRPGQIMPVYLKALSRGQDPKAIHGQDFIESISMFSSAQMIYRWKEKHRMLTVSRTDEHEEMEEIT